MRIRGDFPRPDTNDSRKHLAKIVDRQGRVKGMGCSLHEQDYSARQTRSLLLLRYLCKRMKLGTFRESTD